MLHQQNIDIIFFGLKGLSKPVYSSESEFRFDVSEDCSSLYDLPSKTRRETVKTAFFSQSPERKRRLLR